MFMRCISMLLRHRNYVLLYKSAHYEVIPDYGKRTQYSVLSFFFAVVTILCIDSILYIIIYIIIYNIKIINYNM